MWCGPAMSAGPVPLELYELLQINYGKQARHARRKPGLEDVWQPAAETAAGQGLSQRALADQVGVGFTYTSQCETGTLDFGQYPSEELIRRLTAALDAD